MQGKAPTHPDSDPNFDDVALRILGAAARCFERSTPAQTTIDAIARESGVSRATVFRRFGSWESVYLALLRQKLQPLVHRGLELLNDTGALADRLENATVHTVMAMSQDPSLSAMLAGGPDAQTMQRFESVFLEQVDRTLRQALADGQAQGTVRPGHDLNELSVWYMREYLLLVTSGPWHEEALRRRIRGFIFPVVFSANGPGAAALQAEAAGKLADIEQTLRQLHQAAVALAALSQQCEQPERAPPGTRASDASGG